MARDDEIMNAIERDVRTRFCVIQPSVRVFFYEAWFSHGTVRIGRLILARRRRTHRKKGARGVSAFSSYRNVPEIQALGGFLCCRLGSLLGRLNNVLLEQVGRGVIQGFSELNVFVGAIGQKLSESLA